VARLQPIVLSSSAAQRHAEPLDTLPNLRLIDMSFFVLLSGKTAAPLHY
jgi:hypothetical protein